MSASSNLGLLFFVVAIIYLCFLVILIVRTAIPIFSTKKYPNTRHMQVFRAFYGFLWVQTILNSALYWVLFAGQTGSTTTGTDTAFKSVALVFLPTILMSLDYALMYLQLEDMQKRARSEGGVAYMTRTAHLKLTNIINIVTFTYVGIFIVVQVIVMILTVLRVCDAQVFLVELNVLIFVMLLFLNIHASISYCRNAGNPYLNEKNKKYVRKYKCVILVWNIAFVIKILISFLGVTILNIEDQSKSTDDFGYSLETFCNIMFTEIIPFYMVLDKKIVKIFTTKFLEINVQESRVNSSAETLGSGENDIELDTGIIETSENPYLTSKLISAKSSQSQIEPSPRDVLLSITPRGTTFYDKNYEEVATSQEMIRLTKNGNVVFPEAVVQQERNKLEEVLTLNANQIVKGTPFIRRWYPSERKFLKQKLGALFNCTFQTGSGEQREALCRVMNYDRISSYQIEAFFTELARIQLYKLSSYVVMPLGIHVSNKMEITVVLPNLFSLHDMIHEPQRINDSSEGLSLKQKIAVLVELAKIMNQFHSLAHPFAHGSLNSHNVFVEFDESSEKPIVRLGELEMSDFKRYANMFYTYRSVNVCSPPECLKTQKKRQDPNWRMDVYSFGMLMWEVLYEKVPFEGEVSTAIEYVVDQDARPLILTMNDDDYSQRGSGEPYRGSSTFVMSDGSETLKLTEDLANIIRRCWQTDPAERLSFSNVVKLLMVQQKVLFETEIVDNE